MKVKALLIGICILVFLILSINLASNMTSFSEKSEDCIMAGGICAEENCQEGYIIFEDNYCDTGVCCMRFG